MEHTGVVFDIQRFSVHDGPGIRTLVFFKGCSLHCKWCSNPDGISPEPQIKYRKSSCTGCGKCLACPNGAVSCDPERGFAIDRGKCRLCGACVRACIPKAKHWSGQTRTVDELYDMVKRDRPFFAQEGGVTLGGGDPVIQSEFAWRLLKKCKENEISTAIETAGNYPFEQLASVVPYCDTVFYDVKGWEEARHIEVTGGSNKRIQDNLLKLDALITAMEQKPTLIVRIPILPNFNITQNDMDGIGGFLNKLTQLSHVEILPFHNLGVEKYEQLDMEYDFQEAKNLRAEDMEDFALILGRKGVRHKVISW